MLTVVGFRTIPTGFIPAQDKGYLIVAIQLPDGASLERTDAVVRRASDIILATPGVNYAVAFAGFSGATRANSANAGAIFVGPKPFEERRARPDRGRAAARRLQERLAEIDEASIFVIPPPPVQGLGTAGGFKLLVQDRGGQGDTRAPGGRPTLTSTRHAQIRTSPGCSRPSALPPRSSMPTSIA